MTPLRQFKGVPAEVLRKAEGKQFVRFVPVLFAPSHMRSYLTCCQPWDRYFDLVGP
jgi:hypothetical protein